jgi:putative tryptophan/tyrosine transport system substrate-binding protein
MISRRRCLLGSAALALAPATRVLAQPRGRPARIAILFPGSVTNERALRAALRERGYEEGKTVRFEVRHAHGNYDALRAIAQNLIHTRPDLIITQGTPAVVALREATASIPIVSMSMSDPVGFGVAASLARPGGNVTGLSNLTAELNAKRLALLREVAPGVRRIAYLMRADNPAYPRIFTAMQDAARSLGMQIQRFDMRPPAELQAAFAAMVKARIEALVIADDASYYSHMRQICDAALQGRLVSAADLAMVHAGATIGYGARGPEIARRVASFVDRILKGAKPGELSIERPTVFDFVINLKTAAALGIRVSQETRLSADRVIE